MELLTTGYFDVGFHMTFFQTFFPDENFNLFSFFIYCKLTIEY